MATSHLVVGTYERFLLGYATKPESDVELVKAFTYPAHQGPVRCLAAGGPFLASGGADDQIHLYDLQRAKDLGFLINPGQGAVPCMELFAPRGAAPTHLLSGSAGGGIAIWRAGGSWELLKARAVMKGHKACVNALAVHPSGRLALSVGHDLALRMWDLSKGRCSYTAKLDAEASNVMFAPGGESYALICGTAATLHCARGEGGVLASYTAPARITAVLPQAHDGALLLGLEDGQLQLLDARAGAAVLASGRAHGTRIRGLCALRGEGGGLAGMLPGCFASASSDGVIKVWDARMAGSSAAAGAAGPHWKELCSATTRARVTCLCVAPPAQPPAIPLAGTPEQSARDAEGVAPDQPKQVRRKGKATKGLALRDAPVNGKGAAALEEDGNPLQRGAAKRKAQQQPTPVRPSALAAPAEPHKQPRQQQQQQQQQGKGGAQQLRRHDLLRQSRNQQPARPGPERKGRHAPPSGNGMQGGTPLPGEPGAGGGPDETLVPRVRTRVIKRVNRQQRKAEDRAMHEDLVLEHGLLVDG